MARIGIDYAFSRVRALRKTVTRRIVLVTALMVLICVLREPVSASECSACGYLAKNCSAVGVASASGSEDADVVDVCDASGGIQIDDVFCDDDNCACATGHQCVSTTVGCSNLFQARNRRRCLGNATIAQRFQKCAIAQELTSLNATNLASDWVFFKQGAKCVSTDCQVMRQFLQSGLVQCGNLLVAWKDNASSIDSDSVGYTYASGSSSFLDVGGDVVYHFIADGSRGSDMSPGTFHYSAVWSSASETLETSKATSSAIDACYVLQTRNQPNGTCDGVYLEFDQSVQFANSDEYVLSKLDWPEWFAVVGSVAAAVAAVAIVAMVIYRYQHLDPSPPADEDEDDGLLGELDDLSTRNTHEVQRPESLGSTSPASVKAGAGTELRQRGSGSSLSGDAASTTELEAGEATSTRALSRHDDQ